MSLSGSICPFSGFTHILFELLIHVCFFILLVLLHLILHSLLIVILLNPLALGATHKVIKLSLVTQPL